MASVIRRTCWGRLMVDASQCARTLMLFLACVLAACSAIEPEPLEPPAINVVALQPEAFGINSQVFRLRLGLFNPNSVPLQVLRGSVDLSLAGVRAARGRTINPFTVGAGESAEVEIRVTTNLLRDAPGLLEALSASGPGGGLQYSLSGHVEVERRGPDRIPIRAEGRLLPPTPQPAAPGADAGIGL